MTALHRFATLSLVLALVACGDDPPPPKQDKPAAGKASPAAAKPATAAGKAAAGKDARGKAIATLTTYPKVDDGLRRAFTREDFLPDLTGETNRDPFRSYLVDDSTVSTPGAGKTTTVADECDRRMVADGFGLRDLSLLGIVKKGTTAYALFKDSNGFGHIARRDDCLSKDKARIKEIGASSIVIEVRGDAPPGQPAPDPREEEWRLHPAQLELMSTPTVASPPAATTP